MRLRSLGWEKSPGAEIGNSFQCSCPENSMDGGAWQATVHGVRESRTRLSSYTHTRMFLVIMCIIVYFYIT